MTRRIELMRIGISIRPFDTEKSTYLLCVCNGAYNSAPQEKYFGKNDLLDWNLLERYYRL